jgi:hypothetical protein
MAMKADHRIVQWLALLAISALSSESATVFGQLSFTSSTYTMGARPVCVVAVDLNGAGRLDLICANYSSNTLMVLTNYGNGTFGSNAIINVGAGPYCVVAADVNSDGKSDLITANRAARTLTVLTNNGNGGFGSNVTLNVGHFFAQCVVAADIKGHRNLDLITANFDSTLSVLTNNGSGGWGSNATLAAGYSSTWVVAVDINGDGKPDLIAADDTASPISLTVLTNNGNGAFGFNATLDGGGYPWHVTAADINGDGKPDLITANAGAGGLGITLNTLTVLTNDGSGGFGSNATLTVGTQPACVVAVDVNGDGKLDLTCANSADGTLTVLTNNGSGTFGANATLRVGWQPMYVMAADVNGDGKPDLICANYSGNTLTVLINTTPFTNPPPLNMARAGNQFTLYWPGWAINYALYSSADLSAANWAAVTNATWQGITNYVTVSGVTLTNSSPTLFFRLQGH